MSPQALVATYVACSNCARHNFPGTISQFPVGREVGRGTECGACKHPAATTWVTSIAQVPSLRSQIRTPSPQPPRRPPCDSYLRKSLLRSVLHALIVPGTISAISGNPLPQCPRAPAFDSCLRNSLLSPPLHPLIVPGTISARHNSRAQFPAQFPVSRFGVTTWTRGQSNEVHIEAERDRRKKTTVRRFRVRK